MSSFRNTLKRTPGVPSTMSAVRRIMKPVQKCWSILLGSRRGRSLPRGHYFNARSTLAGYIGFVGKQNLGDEALYDAFLDLFPRDPLIVADGHDPIELWLHRRLMGRSGRFGHVFLGGGTLILDGGYLVQLEALLEAGTPCVVFGTGVRDPAFWARFDKPGVHEERTARWRDALNKCAYVGVRGPESKRLLDGIGVTDVKIVGDPAVVLCTPLPNDRPATGRIAINLGATGAIYGDHDGVVREVAGCIRELSNEGLAFEYIALHRVDARLYRQLVEQLGGIHLPLRLVYEHTNDLLSSLGSYDLVIAERLHMMILAKACAVPTIGLEYRPKHRDFALSFGTEDLLMRTDELTASSLAERARSVLAERSVVSERLASASSRLSGSIRAEAAAVRMILGYDAPGNPAARGSTP